MGLVGLSIAGPRSRELLQRADRRGRLERRAALHGPPRDGHRQRAGDDQPRHLYRRSGLRDLGGAGVSAPALPCDHGGRRAISASSTSACGHCCSLRLEKNFPTWYRELRPIYGAFEGGLERFVDLTKPDFIGREAALREKASGGELRRVSLVVDATDADVLGDEPIWHDGKVIGWVDLRRLRALRRPLARAGLCAEGTCRRQPRARLRDRDPGRAPIRPRSSRSRCSIRKARACASASSRLSEENLSVVADND